MSRGSTPERRILGWMDRPTAVGRGPPSTPLKIDAVLAWPSNGCGARRPGGCTAEVAL